jgi:photosynthetic reaction center H subunit
MAKQMIETEDGVRIAPLSSLKDFQVAEGFRDIRGWKVLAADDSEVGNVHELLIDMDSMRARYVDVRLHSTLAAADGDRDVLVPMGTVRIDDKAEAVVVPLTVERVSLLPPYDHEHLLRVHEAEIRRHFALGEVAGESRV